MKNGTRPPAAIGLATLLVVAAPQAHAETALAKLGRGLAGLTTGFLELPGNIMMETQNQGAIGIPMGFAKGLGMFVTRELVGAYETITAPIPLPANYRAILSPEYPWSYFASARDTPSPRR